MLEASHNNTTLQNNTVKSEYEDEDMEPALDQAPPTPSYEPKVKEEHHSELNIKEEDDEEEEEYKPDQPEEEEESEEELPLLVAARAQQKRKMSEEEEEESEDDMPLNARKKVKKESKPAKSKKRKKEESEEEEEDEEEYYEEKKKKSAANKKKGKPEPVTPEKKKRAKKEEEEGEVWKCIKLSYDLFCNLHLLELHLSSVCFASGVNSRIATGGDDDVNESFGHDDYYNVYSDEDVDSKRWEEKTHNDGRKWTFLEHKGPIFAPPYERLPSSVKFYYDGKEMKLSQDAEEIATFYARMIEHEYTTKE
ncbi:DNA topoisomerase 1-like, partial [Diaphorina citri]|uniref:DNA topoisomerase 1-like n=1 Tax=Diaphorina citri TaxID=121845 RepID=A0A3Q0JKC2_DIACI